MKDKISLTKALYIVGFVASNSLMALCFKKALAGPNSAASSSALNMASNFIFTVQHI